jgi:voltage-gated sodium channel
MEQFPHAYLIFVPFILLTSFIVLNVFIGIIVNSMGEVSADSKERNGTAQDDDPPAAASGVIDADKTALVHLAQELALLKEHIIRLENMMQASQNEVLPKNRTIE